MSRRRIGRVLNVLLYVLKLAFYKLLISRSLIKSFVIWLDVTGEYATARHNYSRIFLPSLFVWVKRWTTEWRSLLNLTSCTFMVTTRCTTSRNLNFQEHSNTRNFQQNLLIGLKGFLLSKRKPGPHATPITFVHKSLLNWIMSSTSISFSICLRIARAFESPAHTTSLKFLAKVILILWGIACFYLHCKLKRRNYEYICSSGRDDLPSLFRISCANAAARMSRIFHAQY